MFEGKTAPASDGSQQHQSNTEPDRAAILAALPQACFVVDNQWRLTFANREAEKVLCHVSKTPLADLLGKDIRIECPEIVDSTFTRECCDALAEQQTLERETFYPALHRWFAVRVSPASDRLIVFLSDVTQQVALQRALTRRAEELMQTDRGKDRFLVELAHVVRNGLATVRNVLHLVGARHSDRDVQQGCEMADHEVRRLGQLMDDLTRLLPSTPSTPRERINVATVIAKTLTETIGSGTAGGRSLSVQLLSPEPMFIEAFPGHLEQVLRHLLDNAVKYTAPGGSIRLTAELTDNEVILRTRDDGVGLTDDVLPHVFNLFMRRPLDQDGRSNSGLGVGLALVRRLVELNGGTVEALSAGVNQGSEFVVRWPRASAGTAAAGKDATRGLQVLVVDDAVEVAQSVALMLREWGCETRLAHDGAEAVRAVRKQRPDLVLMDIGMPVMDGYEAAQQIRQQHTHEDLTLVALTGYGRDEDRDRALEVGYDYHMVKPVDPSDLKDLIDFIESGIRRTDGDTR